MRPCMRMSACLHAPCACAHASTPCLRTQIAINIIVQQISVVALADALWGGGAAGRVIGSKHCLARLLHNVCVTYLLVEAHSGYDLPFMSHRLLPAVFGGSVRHQKHHDTGQHYYHQFFKYIDDYLRW